MADLPEADGAAQRDVDGLDGAAQAPAPGGAAARSTRIGEGAEVLPLLEERLAVSKRRRATGVVRVATRTEVHETVAEAELDRYRVEVTRVPIGRVVDEVPPARAEGDTTVISVVEEQFVVVKRLVLVEEVRIRHALERRVVSEPVTLQRQRATVERSVAEGNAPAAASPE